MSTHVVAKPGSTRPNQDTEMTRVGRKIAISLEAYNHALFKFLVTMNTVARMRDKANSTQTMPIYRSGTVPLEMPRTTTAGR